MKKDSRFILEGSLYKVIITLALPIMLNNLIGSLYNLGDAFWVSKLGDIEVAAISFVWPVSSLALSIASGMAIAGGAIISQYIGASQIDDAKETVQQLYVFGVLFGILSAVIGWLATPLFISLMNAQGALYENSVAYLRILFLEMPLLFMLHIFFSVNQAQGDTLTPTIVNGTSAVLNIILDPIFIFTFHLGIEGAAIATVISKLPFAIYAILRMSRGMGFIKIQPIHLRIHVEKMMRLIKIGIPSSLGSSGVSIGFIVLNSVVAGYGDIAMTAMGIGNRLNGLAFMPGVGIGAALSTITAQNLGAGNIPRVKQAFHASLKLAVLFLLLTGSILWIFSGQLVGIFSDTPAVIETGSYYLNILAATTWSIAFFNCSIGLFNGSGHTSYSMLLEAGRLWVIRMPLIIGFAMIPAFKDTGIWLAIGLSNLISSGFAYLLTFNNRWKQARIKTDH